MMKRYVVAVSALAMTLAVGARASELFVTESVSMNQPKSIEAQLRSSYRNDLWKVKGTDTKVTNTLMRTDVNARWVPMDKLEALLEAPMVNDKTVTKASGSKTTNTNSGLGQVIVGGKYAFCPSVRG